MRIGIDIYPLIRKSKAGIAYHTELLLKTMLGLDSSNEYVLYNHLGKQYSLPYPNVIRSSLIKPVCLNKYSTSWMVFLSRYQLFRDKINIFWGTQGIIPPFKIPGVKMVLTVHDLTVYKYPGTMALDNYFVNKLLLKKALHVADKIVTDSKAVATELVSLFPASGMNRKISTVYSSIRNRFRVIEKDTAIKHVATRLGIREKYVLFVGTIEPRKNLAGLLEAFKILKSRYSIPHQLVIVGARGWKVSSISTLFNKLGFREEDVKFLGYVEEEDLVHLYSGAELFIMPSLYEGFGIPPLEAMACGTPVIASDIPVFREILDEAAYFTDTTNYLNLAESINKVLLDLDLANSLREKGLKRYKIYSWKDSAEKILDIFRECSAG